MIKKVKDMKYARLVITLTSVCKQLQKYLNDDEIAHLIALGMKGEKDNEII